MSEEKDNKQTAEGQVEDLQETVAGETIEAGAEAAPQSDDELAQLQLALGKAEQEATEQREAMLRMHAEMENLRKRLIRDLEKSRKRALETFMNDLLPVRDSLEKGIEASREEGASVESLREGKELILRMLGKVMTDNGLEEIDPTGETFNPELHEAISMIPSPEHDRDQIMDVIQKGYRLNERLIRPARVVVSSGG